MRIGVSVLLGSLLLAGCGVAGHTGVGTKAPGADAGSLQAQEQPVPAEVVARLRALLKRYDLTHAGDLTVQPGAGEGHYTFRYRVLGEFRENYTRRVRTYEGRFEAGKITEFGYRDTFFRVNPGWRNDVI